MDIKALKNEVIEQINGKIASLIQHPTFTKTIFKESFEFKREYRHNPSYDALIAKYKILHIPLNLIVNRKHEFAHRYINHVICFNAYAYKHSVVPENITDFFEIAGANWQFNYKNSPLSSRGIETLMAMNDTLDTYYNIIEKKNNDINKIISSFNSNTCLFKLLNDKYCQVKNVTSNLNNGIINIEYYTLEDNPFHPTFGKFRTSYSNKYSRNIDDIMKYIEIVTLEDVNSYINNCLDKEVSKIRSEINKSENKIVDLKNRMAKLIQKIQKKKS